MRRILPRLKLSQIKRSFTVGSISSNDMTSYFAHSTSMSLPKHLHLTLRYLQENNELKDSINTLFNWLDDQIYENFSSTLANKPADQSTEATQLGLKHLASLEKCLLKIFSGKEGAQFHDDTLIPTNNDSSSNHQTDNLVSRSSKIPVTERNEVIASNVNIIPQNDSYFCDTAINQLIEQLRLRKIERFEPKFPELAKPEDDDSDDSDSGVQIDEEREEREEQTHANVCEERIERESDREIRTRKTRTVNTSKTKKCVTIRTQGTVKLCEDDFASFKDDSNLDCSKIFAARFPQKSTEMVRELADNFNLPKLQPETDLHSNLYDTSNNGNASKSSLIKVSSTTSQCVAKKVKHNGRLISENEAHKTDLANLDMKETQIYQGFVMLDCKGEGAYEENSIIGCGRPDKQSSKKSGREGENEKEMSPTKTNVMEFTKTYGDENVEGKQNFFQASTLASYITLNDNLRFYEEQQRKKISYTYGSNNGTAPTHDYVDLKQLLQSWDSLSENISIPTKYLDESEETELEKFLQPSLEIVTDFLVLRAKDQYSKPTEVRGGPKTALIVYATQTCSLLYQEAFLVTYRSFVSSKELIKKLITRYLYMNSVASREQKTASQEQKAARQTFSLLVRVVHELCTIELTRELVTTVTSFVYKLIRAGNYDFARILRRRLIERIEEKSMNTRPYSAYYSDALSGSAKHVPSIFEFRSSVLAKQITALDAELFNKIEPAEMLWWAEDQNELKSPNVVTFTEHFNRVSYWFAPKSFLSLPKEREKNIC
uniref:Uncharacterized protein n=1 Tax=Ditylenchus dipsaci TaxID=166011 RepID=A0A915CQ03_9BILA